jgi:hypothetical protein
MTDAQTKNLPSSFGGVTLVVGLVAATNIFWQQTASPNEERPRTMPFIDYGLSPSTYGERAYIFEPGNLARTPMPDMEFHSFYTDLMAKQERLGNDFERVLFENLWDLYAR